MEVPTLLKCAAVVADVPGGVSTIRELVLKLAVRGALVPQDPEDGNASALLGDALRTKQRLIEAGEIPKQRKVPETLAEDPPFAIPHTWIWTCLDDVAVYIQRGKSPKYVDRSSVPVVSQKCIQNSGFDLTPARFVDEESLETYGKERFLRTGDLLWNSTGTGTVGRINVFPGSHSHYSIVADSHVTVIRTAECSPDYLHCWLSSPDVQAAIGDRTTGTTKQQELNTSAVRAQPVPLPPRAEQDRIVEMVGTLMKFCDELEARQQTRYQIKARLRASSLDALARAETSSDIDTAWSRIDANWQALGDGPESIVNLRDTILELGIRGRLTQRMHGDEAADETLDRCRGKRTHLLESGAAKKQTTIAETTAELFPLPTGWAWARLDDCFLVTGGVTKSGKRRPGQNAFPYLRVANVQRGRLDLEEISEFELFDGELERYRLTPGDLLVVEGNGSENEIGRCARWSGEIDDCVHQNHLIRCRPLDPDLERFIILYLNSPSGTELMKSLAVTTSGLYNLSVGKIRRIAVPLPPLQERFRIVKRVEELSRLAENLESCLELRSSTQKAVAEALLHAC